MPGAGSSPPFGPLTKPAGFSIAYLTWPWTTLRMVDSLKPSRRGPEKASSRLGPIFPCVPASASVWQLPHFSWKSCLPWAVSALPLEIPPVPQPAASSAAAARPDAAASARTKPESRKAPICSSASVASRVDGEDAVEPGDLEDLRDVAVAAHERQLAVGRPQPLDPPDQHAERRRVDERGVREVDDHLLPALPDHFEQLCLELGCRVEVDLAGQRDDVPVALELFSVDVEIHSRPPNFRVSARYLRAARV